MEFIGRRQELNRLKKEVYSDEMSTVLIYGRRRVGKSELIQQLIRESDCKAVYYECKPVAEANNVKGLADALSDTFALPSLGYSDMDSLLNYIFTLAKNEKMILVLDEYPYLKNTVTGIDGILQSLIDRYHYVSDITFILLGSFVDVMESLLEHENPLYGRIDLKIHLSPMNYYDSSMFYPDYSDEDKVRIYSVFGGIPYYNRLIDDRLSVRENIIRLVSSCDARLENEISVQLSSEIRKMTNANEVFMALARGFSRYNDILSQSHVSSSSALADTLNRLIQMEIIEKTSPINDYSSKKKTGYYICDNLTLFYYRYIFPNLSRRKIMSEDAFYERYISEDFETQYVPKRFETICRDYLIRENIRGNIDPVIEDIGKYYYDIPAQRKNGEFDIVTSDELGYIFYKAKFRTEPVTDSIIRQEIEQVKATGLNCRKYGFFSRSGFSCEENDELILIPLQKLYE